MVGDVLLLGLDHLTLFLHTQANNVRNGRGLIVESNPL